MFVKSPPRKVLAPAVYVPAVNIMDPEERVDGATKSPDVSVKNEVARLLTLELVVNAPPDF